MGQTFLSTLSPDLIRQLEEAGTRRRYPARTFLHHELDESHHVFVIETGLIRVERSLQSGRTILLTLAGPGQLPGALGVIAGTPRSAAARTVVDSRLLAVPADRFTEMMQANGDLAYAVLTRVTRRLRSLTDQLVETTALPAAARVATRLLELLDATGGRVDGDGVIDLRLPISQEELAQWAGLSREGAVKGLGELRSEGIIETARKRVRIGDLSRLEAAAGEPLT